MKKIPLILLLVGSSASLFAQESFTKDEYLRKAKNNKTVAWVLLGGGVGLIGTSVIMNNAGIRKAQATYQPRNNGTISSLCMVTGGAMMLSSTPFFVFATVNKENAASAFLKIEGQTGVVQGSFVRKSYPAIGIKISL